MLRLLLVVVLLVVVIVTIVAVPSLRSDHTIDTNNDTNSNDVNRELSSRRRRYIYIELIHLVDHHLVDVY